MCGKRKRCQKSTATVFGNVKLPQQLIKIICQYAVPTLADQLNAFLLHNKTGWHPMTWQVDVGFRMDHEHRQPEHGFYKLSIEEFGNSGIIVLSRKHGEKNKYITWTTSQALLMHESSLPCSSCQFQRLCYSQVFYAVNKRAQDTHIDIVVRSPPHLPTLNTFRGFYYLE